MAGLAERLASADPVTLFGRDTWRACAAEGFTGLPVDPRWGGRGRSLLETADAFEAFAAEGAPPGLVFALGAQLWAVTMVLARFGSDDQRARWLRPLCAGEIVAGHAMTEPSTGSDAFALATTARERGDTIVLDGAKTFVTNGPNADVFLVFATTDRALGWAGISAYLVDRHATGVTVASTIRTMTPWAAPLAEVAFDECAVAPTDRIGTGNGMAMFTHAMELERTLLAAGQLGLVTHQLATMPSDSAVARDRMASLRSRVSTSRTLVHHSAARLDSGRSAPLESSLAKVSTSELWAAAARLAVEGRGAAGMLDEAAAALCDSVAATIYSGTSELQRELIGRRLGLK